MNIDGIKERLATDLPDPIANLCLSIVSEIEKIPRDELQRLTFPILAKFAGKPATDSSFHSAVTALTNVTYHPLTLYFIFLDIEDDRELEVSASEVMTSVDEGRFVHPRTGNSVPNFAKLLQPVYRVSDEFAAVLEASKS